MIIKTVIVVILTSLAMPTAARITENLPTLSFAVAQGDGSERIANVSVQVVLSQLSTKAVSATLATSGSAMAGLDFALPSTTVTIPAGQTSAMVRILIIDDKMPEADEVLTLTLSNPKNAQLGQPSFTYTIHDEDKRKANNNF